MSTIISTAPPATHAEALRRRAVDMIIAATIGLVAVIAIAGMGGDSASGPLSWTGDAQVFRHPTIPGDRVLTGKLQNASERTLRVDIGDVRLVTSGGEVVASNPVFLQSFGKSLWAAGRGPRQVPDSELQRTGRIALLSPGEEVPITIAWHDKDGTPARVAYKQGSVTVPG
jgi:hypothetical protein